MQKAYNLLGKLELICESLFIFKKSRSFWISKVILLTPKTAGRRMWMEQAFIFNRGLTNNSCVSHRSLKKLSLITFVVYRKRGDESLSRMRREWWYTNKLLLQTVPTCWLRVFPAGSISTYAVGDWGECQQNHTLAWNRCSRAAVQDGVRSKTETEQSNANFTAWAN